MQCLFFSVHVQICAWMWYKSIYCFECFMSYVNVILVQLTDVCLIFHSFTEMPTNNFVESSFWNFDALFQPQQHPARDAHDTFFISGMYCLNTMDAILNFSKCSMMSARHHSNSSITIYSILYNSIPGLIEISQLLTGLLLTIQWSYLVCYFSRSDIFIHMSFDITKASWYICFTLIWFDHGSF